MGLDTKCPPGQAEARWDAKQRVWDARVPSSGWTRLRETYGPDASDADLLVGVRRLFGYQQTRGLRLVKQGLSTRVREGGDR
jgi:hypothetical protein